MTELLEFHKIPVNQVEFILQINQPADFVMKNHPWGKVMMTKAAAEYILPLVRTIGFKDVQISEKLPKEAISLSDFRKLKLNTSAGEIRSWYYELVSQHLPQDYSRKIINVEKNTVPEVKDKIVLCLTNRYRNCFLDLKVLEGFKKYLVFLGFDSEYESFCKEFFELDRIETKDGLHTARIFNSAIGVLSNQSGNYTIAEQMKCNRILMSPEFIKMDGRIYTGPVDNLPQGGWNETVRSQGKLIPALKNLLGTSGLFS